MAIPASLLIETAKRYAGRKDKQEKREATLKKVQWHPNMNVMERIKALKGLDSPERLEKRLKRLSTAAFQYMQTSTESLAQLITEVQQPFDEVVLERILGQKDLLGINFLERGSVAARTVGRVVMKNSLGGTVGYGTGFMISPRLLMTNNHVLRDSRDAAFSHIEFDNQLDLTGILLQPITYRLDPNAFFATSRELDVTIVAVAERTAPLPLVSFGWNKLIEEEGKVVIGEYMNVIQHPEGRPKECSFRANQLTDVFTSFLHYQTDTEPGSSGSPVFNDQWEVVGLHHSGVPKRNAAGKILNKKGKEWTPAMGEDQIEWIANEGIRISSITKFIKQLTLQGAQAMYRNEVFDLDPPTVKLCYLSNEQFARLSAPSSSEQKQHEVAEDGSFLYTIPIQVKVQVNGVAAMHTKSVPPAMPSVTPLPAVTGIQNPPAVDALPDTTASAIVNTEYKEALQELEAAKKKPYYVAADDKKQRDQYYKTIKKTGVSAIVFYNQLQELLTDTHENELPYRPAKQLYTWVDLQPNKKLRSIYSGKEFEPEKVIEEDFRNEMRLIEFAESLMRESADLTNQQVAEKIALFEATLPYNCEHVVPQSWFGKQEPMRGDLHHLFTCESGCNSFRGNIPYFDFADFEEVVRGDCGKREQNRFEPERGKGEVARATLYFLLRYPEEINKTTNEYTADRIATLVNWHNTFKVTDHEKHRNAAIYAKQGNRNPLIDFPDWGSKIDFRQGLG